MSDKIREIIWTPPGIEDLSGTPEAEITRLRAEVAELRERLEAARESMVESAVHEFAYGTQRDKLRAQVAAHERECAGTMVPMTERLPSFGEGIRVVIFTEGHDFDGEQYFHVEADSLNESFYEHPEDQPEVSRLATHWIDTRLPGEM